VVWARLSLPWNTQTPSASRFQVAQDLGLQSIQRVLQKDGNNTQLDPIVVDSVVKAVKQWLSRKKNTGWLLIFDDVNESEPYDIMEFVPLSFSERFILIHRREDHARFRDGLKVGNLEEEEGIQLLRNYCQSDAATWLSEGKSPYCIDILSQY
jgi:hypothetical protein